MTANADPIDGPNTVLVMAANRRGIADPVARMGGVSHKCLVPIAGTPMIERVLRTIENWGRARRILVSIEDATVLDTIPYIAEMRRQGRLEVVTSGATLSESVFRAAEKLTAADYPLVVATADNVLHTPELIDRFCSEAMASEADIALALTPRAVVAEKYPDDAPDVGYLKFREDEHSNCNIYFLRSPSAISSARVLRDGGQFRSHPLRILRAFGLTALIAYKLGLASRKFVQRRLERLFGTRVDIVILPYAEAPIDADNPTTFALAERILHQRENPDSTPATAAANGDSQGPVEREVPK